MTADNASNMIKAFNVTQLFTEDWTPIYTVDSGEVEELEVLHDLHHRHGISTTSSEVSELIEAPTLVPENENNEMDNDNEESMPRSDCDKPEDFDGKLVFE